MRQPRLERHAVVIWLSTLGPARILATAIILLSFIALCSWTAWRESKRRRAEHRLATQSPADASKSRWLVVHASQTGTAEQLAWQAAQALQLTGASVQIASLAGVSHEHLQRVGRALFIVSTYGEGDPPDTAAPFVRNTMLSGDSGNLGGLHYGLLALGDSTYARFCGFGRALDGWLRDRQAQPLFERIDADRTSETAITSWRRQLAHLAGTGEASGCVGPRFTRWQLAARRHLNPDSPGERVCHLELTPVAGASLPRWEAGDLLQMRVPGEEQPREYSIASLPADGSVHLLVRQARRADGSAGIASGWLLSTARVGDELDARIREHRGFHLGNNAHRPLILIGNGTGLAGLRALIKAREGQPMRAGTDARCWLLFGERSSRHDVFYPEDLARWRDSGILTRCDLVYSRDQPERRYVQHRLAECAQEVSAWLDAGAAIYVCGSLKGMATEVDAALGKIVGRAPLDALIASGRYRRDVY